MQRTIEADQNKYEDSENEPNGRIGTSDQHRTGRRSHSEPDAEELDRNYAIGKTNNATPIWLKLNRDWTLPSE